MSCHAQQRHKQALVLAPFFNTNTVENRPFTVACALTSLCAVHVVTTDFDHSTKDKKQISRTMDIERIVYLKTRPYRNNISVQRLLSHLEFSWKAAIYFLKNKSQYDIVYVSMPFNILTWFVFHIARGQQKIADVIDIWPDVLPFPARAKVLLTPILRSWKWFFRAAIARADVVMAVSDEFLREASLYTNRTVQMKRFYIGRDRLPSAVSKRAIITIAYVGNLGRLYDFDTLIEVLSEEEMRATLQLFVIGDGDRREYLLRQLKRRGIRHDFFGTVYDPVRLADILRSCHVGFNGFINTTAAFSYKATTYFAAGLPILNSMKGDLEHLVREHGLGINYTAGDRADLQGSISRVIHGGTEDMAANCERFFAAHLELSNIKEEMKAFFLQNPAHGRLR